ncbi:hypothetical protein Tco_0899434 [Tanacetum coccineum]
MLLLHKALANAEAFKKYNQVMNFLLESEAKTTSGNYLQAGSTVYILSLDLYSVQPALCNDGTVSANNASQFLAGIAGSWSDIAWFCSYGDGFVYEDMTSLPGGIILSLGFYSKFAPWPPVGFLMVHGDWIAYLVLFVVVVSCVKFRWQRETESLAKRDGGFSSLVNSEFKSRANSWIRYAIRRNVEEVDLWLFDVGVGQDFTFEDELFFNTSCITHNNKIGKIISGSPCLESMELKEIAMVIAD